VAHQKGKEQKKKIATKQQSLDQNEVATETAAKLKARAIDKGRVLLDCCRVRAGKTRNTEVATAPMHKN